MTIACTNRGTAASNASSSTTYAFSPSGNYAAGSTAVLCISADNSVTGGATNNITSVTDSLGNTWTLVQKPIFDNGSASAGIQGGIAVSHMSAGTLTTGTTITVTFGAATTAKSYTLHEVVPTAGLIATYKTGGVAAGQSATTSPTMTSGTIAIGNLLIATVAMESGTTQTFTDDADADNGTWSASQYSEVGSTTSGNCIATQYKVQTTLASTQAYDPTLGAAADTVGAWAEFTEVNPAVMRKTHGELPVKGRRSPQAGFLEISVNALLLFLVPAALNYTVREPLVVPIKHRSTTQQVERAPNLLTTTLAGSGNVTLALSGTAVTASAGTLAPSSSVATAGQEVASSAGTLTATIGQTAALTGTAVSASPGTLAPSASVALTGTEVAASAGTITATTGTSIALTGAEVTSSAGTLAPSASVALAGQAATASAGTLAPDAGTLTARAPLFAPVVRKAGVRQIPPGPNLLTGTLAAADGNVAVGLTGQSVTVSAGTLGALAATYVLEATINWGNPERSRRVRQPTDVPNLLTSTLSATADVTVGLSGQAATASAGTLAPASALALSGQAVTASAGTITANIGSDVTVALSGAEVTGGAGTLSPTFSLALSGQALTSSAGTLTPSTGTVVALTGTAVTASAGDLAKSISIGLTGAESAIGAGTISPALAKALTGLSVASSAGELTPTLTLDGIAVTSSAGTIAPSVTISLSGQEVAVSAGTMVPPSGLLIGTSDRTITSELSGRIISADGAGRIITVRGKSRTIE